jgi:hypothetical protein
MFHQSRLTVMHTLALTVRRIKYGAPQEKVFCIGLQKTGTTSLQYALSKLGYRVGGVFSIKDLQTREQMRERALSLLPRFDAVADNPWCVLYPDLDRESPGAKFIMTVRDPERWYASVCSHFGEKPIRMHEWIYGVSAPVGHKQAYLRKLLEHQEAVRQYFINRPSDLMEFDVSRGDGWEKLCGFLGKRMPVGPFPRLNTVEMRRQ